MKKLNKYDRARIATWLRDRLEETEPGEDFVDEEDPGLIVALRRLLAALEN